MADRPFTLIDVMNGMYNLSLQTRLTPPCFRFFWGLVMKANELKPRFKNPFDLTVDQAIGLGGGKTRQAVNQKQKILTNVLVDGRSLMHITPGSRKQNLAAKYQINYKLIIPQIVTINETTEQPSREFDEHDPNMIRSRSDLDPILRSDQKRKEQPPVSQMIKFMQDKWPHPNPPAYAQVKRMLDKYGQTIWTDAVDSAPYDMTNGKWHSIFNYVDKVAKGLKPKAGAKERTPEEKAIFDMKRAVDDYRTLDLKTDRSRLGNSEMFLVNTLRQGVKWYDNIDNFGDIVGMDRGELEGIMKSS